MEFCGEEEIYLSVSLALSLWRALSLFWRLEGVGGRVGVLSKGFSWYRSFLI